MPHEVSAAYLDGIRDGRALLRVLQSSGEPIDAAAHAQNASDTLRGFSGPVADHLRGVRDFWRNQAKR